MVKSYDEGVIAGGQDFLFGKSAFDFISLDHLFLAENCKILIAASGRSARALSTFHSI